MTEVLVNCPHCGNVIPERDVRRERPFSCLTCKQTVAILDLYKRLPMSGCLVSFISVMVLATPDLLIDIAKVLESLAVLQAWTSEQDRQLYSLAKQDSLDEPLVGAALVAAREVKTRLTGCATTDNESSKEIQALELAAISLDLRIAAS